MTIKIELSDESFRKAQRAFHAHASRINMKPAFKGAITAALEAMVEEGMAHVVTRGTWSTKLSPAKQDTVIIRLGGKP